METYTRVLAIDPGNSTGWVYRDVQGTVHGGTIGESLNAVVDLIKSLRIDYIVYETFQLYPSKAAKMMWNTFYPCEVIGVIKYISKELTLPLVAVQPSAKKFSGVQSGEWKCIGSAGKVTEHTRDAYQLLRFFERNKGDLVK